MPTHFTNNNDKPLKLIYYELSEDVLKLYQLMV